MSGGGREGNNMACVKRNAFSEFRESGHLQFYVCRSGGREGGWAGERVGVWTGGRAVGGAGGLDILIYVFLVKIYLCAKYVIISRADGFGR